MTTKIELIDPSNKKEVDFILEQCAITFGPHMGVKEDADISEKKRVVIGYLKGKYNINISIKITNEQGDILGFYLLNDNTPIVVAAQRIPKFYSVSKENSKALEGVTLVIVPEYRNHQLSKKLIDATEKLGYDFIFGLQMTSLNNLDFWQNHGRNLIKKVPGLNITGKWADDILKSNVKSSKKINIQHLFQPDGLSCGPTCAAMIATSYDKFNTPINELNQLIRLDNITGTTPDKMMFMLNYMGIIYRTPKKENRNMDYLLNDVLGNNNWGIIRTLTQGVKHWILAHDYDRDDNHIKVMDPWLGELEYTLEKFESIWKPREYYFLEIVHKDNLEF